MARYCPLTPSGAHLRVSPIWVYPWSGVSPIPYPLGGSLKDVAYAGVTLEWCIPCPLPP